MIGIPTPNTMFGDYTLSRARGRHHGMCAHCFKPTKDRPTVGQAESSVREHLRDVHKITEPKVDVRQSLRWSQYS